MNQALHQHDGNAEELLKPESPLETKLLAIPDFNTGLHWGKPRFGHPEGSILLHIREVLDNIDQLDLSSALARERLRLIAFAHDTFKHLECPKRQPRDWSKHHGVLARQFMEQHTSDPTVLNIIQWHDEVFYCWRMAVIYHNPAAAEKRLAALLDYINDDLLLYYQFFICDTQTGDKYQGPIKWFESRLEGFDFTKP